MRVDPPDDFLCERCGHALHGIDPRGRCPGCDTTMGESCVRAGVDPTTLLPTTDRPLWRHSLIRPSWYFKNAPIAPRTAILRFLAHVASTMVLVILGGALFAWVEGERMPIKQITIEMAISAALSMFCIGTIIGLLILLAIWAFAWSYLRLFRAKGSAHRSLSIVLVATIAWPIGSLITLTAMTLLSLYSASLKGSGGLGEFAFMVVSFFVFGGPLIGLGLWITLTAIGVTQARYANSPDVIARALAHARASSGNQPREAAAPIAAPPPA